MADKRNSGNAYLTESIWLTGWSSTMLVDWDNIATSLIGWLKPHKRWMAIRQPFHVWTTVSYWPRTEKVVFTTGKAKIGDDIYSRVVRAPDCQCQKSQLGSQHPQTRWNLRGSRWSSVEYSTFKKFKKSTSLKICEKYVQTIPRWTRSVLALYRPVSINWL
jgi:hypothetical protein